MKFILSHFIFLNYKLSRFREDNVTKVTIERADPNTGLTSGRSRNLRTGSRHQFFPPAFAFPCLLLQALRWIINKAIHCISSHISLLGAEWSNHSRYFGSYVLWVSVKSKQSNYETINPNLRNNKQINVERNHEKRCACLLVKSGLVQTRVKRNWCLQNSYRPGKGNASWRNHGRTNFFQETNSKVWIVFF